MVTRRGRRPPSWLPALALVLMSPPLLALPAEPPPAAPPLDASALPVVPRPAKITARRGSFSLTAATRIQAPAPLVELAERFRAELHAATGLPLPISAHAAGSRIVLALDRLTALGDEGYKLVVSPGQVRVTAPAAAGLFYGLQSFRQLLPAAVFRRAQLARPEGGWQAPCVEIEDQPRFKWRGSHLDVGRHFMSKETILKHLDLMALHKLNVFHWHLTEDQGWRLEIKKYPRLTEVGAARRDEPAGPTSERDAQGKRIWKYLGRAHGGFYTQDDAREVVRYAADRFITVVPEIEMPGHARAAVAAYPELGNTGNPVEVGTHWGVFEDVLNVEDRTLAFTRDVLDEVLAIFPSRFIHIGGDEVPKKQWKESPAAQARMKQLGLKNEDELQSWFVKQLDTYLTGKGRRLIGWDEILEGGLAPGATVMSWRGIQGGIAAARAGHDVVMAPEQPTYFDHYQVAPETPLEPPAHRGLNTLESVYAWEPVPAELNAAEAEHVLGAQAQLWTEYMATPKQVEYQAWPRLCAMSEVLWSPREPGRDFAAFRTRLVPHLVRLKILDVNFRPLEGPFPKLVSAP
jgi:hexosaminidase